MDSIFDYEPGVTVQSYYETFRYLKDVRSYEFYFIHSLHVLYFVLYRFDIRIRWPLGKERIAL